MKHRKKNFKVFAALNLNVRADSMEQAIELGRLAVLDSLNQRTNWERTDDGVLSFGFNIREY